MAGERIEDGTPLESGPESGGEARVDSTGNRRDFFAALAGAGAGLAASYSYGRPRSSGEIVEATEADLQQIEEEPYPGMDVEEWAQRTRAEMQAEFALAEGAANMTEAERVAFYHSCTPKEQAVLLSAAPFFFAGIADEDVGEGVQQSRRGFLKTGAVALGAGALALAGTPQEAEASMDRETLQQLVERMANSDDANYRMIESQATEMAVVYDDITGDRRPGESPQEFSQRTTNARMRVAEPIELNERSNKVVNVRGHEYTLPTLHSHLKWREERPVRIGDRKQMGRMNYIVSTSTLMRGNDNPIGYKIAKRLSLDDDMAARRFEHYKDNY